MKQELEIEYKNLLTKNEYYQLLEAELINHPASIKTTQTNHYFDTSDKLLKKQHAALRIRKTATGNELTFKVPAQDFLMETNFPLNEGQTKDILEKKQFSLDEITTKRIDLKLPDLMSHSIFRHFNQFQTVRYEKQVGDHLMVLDQTTFQNGVTDYELEVESQSPLKGRIFFDSLLGKYTIPSRSTLPKIARAEKNR